MGAVDGKDLKGYFGWLLKQIDCERRSETEVNKLYLLHTIPFTYSVKMDVNRSYDAIRLRKEYFGEDAAEEIIHVPCSVLEVMIGLAKRVSEEVLGEDVDLLLKLSPKREGDLNRTFEFFWLMLMNLKLADEKEFKVSEEEIKELVSKWIHRDFDSMGVGSPFPLTENTSGIDQKQIELWKQLSLYLSEKIED